MLHVSAHYVQTTLNMFIHSETHEAQIKVDYLFLLKRYQHQIYTIIHIILVGTDVLTCVVFVEQPTGVPVKTYCTRRHPSHIHMSVIELRLQRCYHIIHLYQHYFQDATTLEPCTPLVSSLLVTTDVVIVTVAPMAKLPVIIHHVVSVICITCKRYHIQHTSTYIIHTAYTCQHSKANIRIKPGHVSKFGHLFVFCPQFSLTLL